MSRISQNLFFSLSTFVFLSSAAHSGTVGSCLAVGGDKDIHGGAPRGTSPHLKHANTELPKASGAASVEDLGWQKLRECHPGPLIEESHIEEAFTKYLRAQFLALHGSKSQLKTADIEVGNIRLRASSADSKKVSLTFLITISSLENLGCEPFRGETIQTEATKVCAHSYYRTDPADRSWILKGTLLEELSASIEGVAIKAWQYVLADQPTPSTEPGESPKKKKEKKRSLREGKDDEKENRPGSPEGKGGRTK